MTTHGRSSFTGEGAVVGRPWQPTGRQIVQGVLGMLLAVALVIWWLPRISPTSWSAVGDTLGGVGFGSVVSLFGLMCLGLWTYTFTVTGSLPGLRHRQALIVNLCGSSAGNLVPAGGAAGVAVTYAAFRSWGFSRRDISTSIIATGVWNILARMVLPVSAMIALLVAGGDLPEAVVLGGILGAAVGLTLLALFIAALSNAKVTRSIGRALNRLLRPMSPRIPFLRGLAIEDLITDQRMRMISVVRRGWARMTFGMVAFLGVFFVLFWQSMHVVGLRMPFAHLFAAYAVGRLISAIGITPGGLGVTEGAVVAVLAVFGADAAQALAGTVLFSLFTHVMEVPLGTLAYLGWALSKKTAPTDGAEMAGVVSRHTPVPEV